MKNNAENLQNFIKLEEVTEKILINPYQFNLSDLSKDKNEIAVQIFTNTANLLFSEKEKITVKELENKNNVETHLNFLKNISLDLNDTVYKEYPDIYFEYKFLIYIGKELNLEPHMWEGVLFRVMEHINNLIFFSIKIENLSLYGEEIPYIEALPHPKTQKEINLLFDFIPKIFHDVIKITNNKLTLPYGSYTFRKLMQIMNKNNLNRDKQKYDKICKKYEDFANDLLFNFIKNDKKVKVIKNAIIKIKKGYQKEVDLLIVRDNKITIFEHKGPISSFVSEDKYFEGIFVDSIKKSLEFNKFMREGNFTILDPISKEEIIKNNIETNTIFTSLINWGKGLSYDLPTISIGSIMELFFSYRFDTIKPSLKILWDYIEFKYSKVHYDRMNFDDFKTWYNLYIEGKGDKKEPYSFLSHSNKQEKSIYVDFDNPTFVFSTKQIFNYFLFINEDLEKTKNIYPQMLHQIITGKIFGYTTEISVDTYDELCELGFSSERANEELVKMEPLNIIDIIDVELYITCQNIRLRCVDDVKLENYMKKYIMAFTNTKK